MWIFRFLNRVFLDYLQISLDQTWLHKKPERFHQNLSPEMSQSDPGNLIFKEAIEIYVNQNQNLRKNHHLASIPFDKTEVAMLVADRQEPFPRPPGTTTRPDCQCCWFASDP